MSKLLTKYKLSDKVPSGASRLILPANKFGDSATTIHLDKLTDAQADTFYARKDGRGEKYLIPVKGKRVKTSAADEIKVDTIVESADSETEDEPDCGCPK